jgi:hypothetical protein
VARTLVHIGTVYRRAGNDEAAVKNYREAVERLSATLGGRSVTSQSSFKNYRNESEYDLVLSRI